MGFVLCFILLVFAFIGFFIGNKFLNKNLFSLVYGFILFEFILKYIPISYDMLLVNFHDATFLYILLTMILGVIVVNILNTCNLSFDNSFNWCFYLLTCFIVAGKGFGITFISYILISIIMGIHLYDTKKSVFELIPFMILGCILHSINNWMIGYVLGFLIGIICYFIVKNILIVIKNKQKGASVLLIIGMLLSFVGVLFK